MTEYTNLPDTEFSARELFGIDTDMKVMGYKEANSHVPPVDPDYLFDRNTTLAILAGFAFNRRVMVQGYHGTGKSTHIEQVAARLNWPLVRVNLDSHVSRIDLVGKDAIVLKDGKQITEFRDGILPWAVQNNVALVFDEYDAGRPDVMFVIQRVLEVSGRLTLLEFEGGGVLHDALAVLQRAELVTRMAVEVERYIVELGTEGRVIEMQLEETMVGVAADKTALIRDYAVEDTEEGLSAVLHALSRMPHQDVLDFGRLAELLGYDRKLNTLDHPVSPRGHRVLGRIPRLPKLVVQGIVREFGGLDEILAAGDGDLESVEGVGDVRAKDIREGLRRLQEINLVDRYLQT